MEQARYHRCLKLRVHGHINYACRKEGNKKKCLKTDTGVKTASLNDSLIHVYEKF